MWSMLVWSSNSTERADVSVQWDRSKAASSVTVRSLTHTDTSTQSIQRSSEPLPLRLKQPLPPLGSLANHNRWELPVLRREPRDLQETSDWCRSGPLHRGRSLTSTHSTQKQTFSGKMRVGDGMDFTEERAEQKKTKQPVSIMSLVLKYNWIFQRTGSEENGQEAPWWCCHYCKCTFYHHV